MACFLLVTFLPVLPLLSVPAFRSCMTFATLALLALLYFLAIALPPYSPMTTMRLILDPCIGSNRLNLLKMLFECG